VSVASSSLILGRPGVKPAAFPAAAGRVRSVRHWGALGKEAMLVFAGQAAAGLGSIVAVRLLTTLLPPAVFGEYALSLTVVMILQYCYAGTSAAAMRFFVPAVEKAEVEVYLIAAWRMQHVRGLLVVLLALGGTVILVATGQTALLPLAGAALVIAVVTSYGTFMDGLQNAARQRAVVALHQGAGAWLRLACAALLIILVSASAASVLWGFALSAVLIMGSQYVFYRRIKHRTCQAVEHENTSVLRRQWHQSMTTCAWPYVIWSVPVWLQFSADRWCLEWLASPADVGIYAALFQLTFLPINTVTQLITQLAMPILFARAGDLTDSRRVASSRSLNAKLVWITLVWTVVAVGAVTVLQVPLGHLLLDARYHGCLHLLPPFVLAVGLFSTTQLAELNLITANQTTSLIWPKCTVGVLACATYLAGAYWGGIVGVVWAAVITRVWMLIWIVRIDRRFLAASERPSIPIESSKPFMAQIVGTRCNRIAEQDLCTMARPD
jgi:O-antigen/teichoic acid export membrane protein